MNSNLKVEVTKTNDNSSSNLDNILLGFNGTMAVVGETASQLGGMAGKKFSAVFNIVNGVVSEVIEYGDSELSQVDLEKVSVGLLASYSIGKLAAASLQAIGASNPYVIVGAGIATVVTEVFKDDIYGIY